MDEFRNFVEIQMLKKQVNSMDGNLVRHDLSFIAEEGQTVFPITLSTFDKNKDSIIVQSGITMLSSTRDYVVEDTQVVLNEGVPAGRTIDIYVYKNVPRVDEEKVLSFKIDRQIFQLEAESEGQTEFVIPMTTFNTNTDFVFVHAGTLSLLEGADFTVEGRTITLAEGVHQGCTVGIIVLKNMVVADATITSDMPLHFGMDEEGGLVIEYDDGIEEG